VTALPGVLHGFERIGPVGEKGSDNLAEYPHRPRVTKIGRLHSAREDGLEDSLPGARIAGGRQTFCIIVELKGLALGVLDVGQPTDLLQRKRTTTAGFDQFHGGHIEDAPLRLASFRFAHASSSIKVS
jgi:hypothetical protein